MNSLGRGSSARRRKFNAKMRRQNSHQGASGKKSLKLTGFPAAGALNIVRKLAPNRPVISKIEFGIVERQNNDVDDMVVGHGGLAAH